MNHYSVARHCSPSTWGFGQAQKLADEFRVEMLHWKLDAFADRYCPVVMQFGLNYH
jgi:hypothetical protein